MFRVVRNDDRMLMGTRYDLDMEGDPMIVNAKVKTGTENPEPSLIIDDRKTAGVNEKNTMLSALGEEFSMGDLLGGGAATVAGPNIVDEARAEMVKIRDRVAALVDLRNDDGIDNDAFNRQIDNQWDEADKQIKAIFGGSPELERTASASRVVDAFDRVVNALSSEEAFAAATLADGPDQLDGFITRTAANVGATFNRNKSTATARLGAIGSTRFGAAVYNETDKAQSGFGDAERAQAFAWSTMQQVRRASDVQAAGTATYAGQTLAADEKGNLYSGTIDVTVSFTRMNVNGLVTELARADTQAPWTYGLGGEVTGIHLPDAPLHRRGMWTVEGSGNNTGRLQYEPQAGGEPDFDLENGNATFAGRLLGRGDASGDEAIGTWSVRRGTTVLAGGFGAERGADRAPPGAGVTDDLATIGEGSGGERAEFQNVPDARPQDPADRDPDDDPDTPLLALISPKIGRSTVLNLNNTKFKYDPPTTDDIPATEFVTGSYEPQRADVLADGDWDDTKGNWVQSAREEITKRLSQLERIIDLDTADSSAADRAFSKEQRQRLFNEIQLELQKVLGDGGGTVYTGVLTQEPGADEAMDYPVNTAGTPEDAGVLAEIEDVLEALADADAFAAAFDEGGVFAMTKANTMSQFTDGYPTPSAMFNRARGKLTMSTDYTSFTRFGGWNHQVSANAARGLNIQTVTSTVRDDRGPEFGAFVYSPLEPTAAYASVSSRLYPAGATTNVTATYAGRTVAAQGSLFYRGEVEATVFWNASDFAANRVRLTISNIVENESGDTLEFGYAGAGGPVLGTAEVDSLSWTTPITNDGTVKFASTSAVKVTVNDVDGTPDWRPAYGPYRAVGATTELSTAEQADYGPGIAGNRLRHFQSSTLSELRIAVTAGDLTGQKWVANVGAGGGGDLGAVTFKGLGTGRHVLTMTTSGNAFDEAKAKFEAGQANLIYPTHVISGIRTTKAAGQPKAGERDSRILLFADGSTAHMHEHFDHDIPLIGTTGNDAMHTTATRFTGTPNLEDRDDLLWFDYGQSYHAFPELDGDGTTAIGVGAPDGAPGTVAAAWLRANNQYVNVAESDTGALASEIEGMFVGQDQQGPLGIIGTWSLTGGAFGTSTNREAIRGAFGADFKPEP